VDSSDRIEAVKSYAQWIAPGGGVESLSSVDPAKREVRRPEWATDEEMERAVEGAARLDAGQELDPEHAVAVEAIILPQERPVMDVVGGTFEAPGPPFEDLATGRTRENIDKAIPAVGRIDLPDQPSLPYGGTGFVVGDGLLMTNRHVAQLFASGLGREQLSFINHQHVDVDFLHERDSAATRSFAIREVLMIHPYWDMALLAIEGLRDISPLRLATADPGDLVESEVAVIGYPALDPRNNVELQNRIFRSVFNIKRMQPGKLRTRADIASFEHTISAVTHDASTLGGNSGSAVVDVDTGLVVALHFAGVYLQANYAVPARELARDRRVVDAGVTFDADVVEAGALPSDRFWADADPAPGGGGGERAVTTSSPDAPTSGPDAPTSSPDAPLQWTIPLELTVGLRAAGGGAAVTATASTAPTPVATEALVEPFHDAALDQRHGYDDAFLGNGLVVPVPKLLDDTVAARLSDGSTLLPYEHFSLSMHKTRRLALFTASNVDANPARKRPEPGHDYSRKGLTGLGKNDQEKWFTDPRIAPSEQLPDRFFTKDHGAFDKGHIVRREDVAWGATFEEVRRANGDTFHVTNCSPQIADFNRSNQPHGIWGQLENLVLTQAKTERYCLLAGPVLAADDRVFVGEDDAGPVHIQIPRRFFKVVVAHGEEGKLEAYGFVLEQDLGTTPLEFVVDAEWRSRMIAIDQLELLTGLLTFDQALHDGDQIDTPKGEAIQGHPAVGRVDR
jgi:endonuclease G, mitochondrial